jgi:hypothetical protein
LIIEKYEKYLIYVYIYYKIIKRGKMKKYNKEIVEKWWLNLDDRIKEEIMDVFFPGDFIFDIDDEWKRLDYKIKLEIYKENNL